MQEQVFEQFGFRQIQHRQKRTLKSENQTRPGARQSDQQAHDVKLHYTGHYRLPEAVEKELNVTFHPDAESMVKVCDVVTINAPLHPETENMFNEALLSKMKRGAYLLNTARAKICDTGCIAASELKGHQLLGLLEIEVLRAKVLPAQIALELTERSTANLAVGDTATA